MLSVKVCGITTVADAQAAAAAGADYLGLNFVSSSKRFIEPARAARLIQDAALSVTWVGVVADLARPALQQLRAETGVDALQLHGHESPELLASLPPSDFQAVRIGSAADVAASQRYGGALLLVDAKAPGGELGGTGHSFDWRLVTALAKRRRIFLAGGLRPDNVAQAVQLVRPFGVDVASGVESSPGRKDTEKMQAFIRAARAAA